MVMNWHFQAAAVKQNLKPFVTTEGRPSQYCLSTGTHRKVQDVLTPVYIHLLETRN